MTYLAIGGYALPIATVSGPQVTERELGYRGDSGHARPRRHVRAKVNVWACATTLVPAELARSIRDLVRGRGHSFNFSSGIRANSGLRLSTGYRAAVATSGGSPGNALVIESGLSVTIDGNQSGGRWTVLFRAKDSGGAFVSYAKRDDGEEWADGVQGSDGTYPAIDNVMTHAPEVADGSVTLTGKDENDASIELFIDSIVLLPWRAHPDMLDAWTSLGGGFSPLPALTVTGDIGVGKDVHGTVTDRPFEGAHFDATHDNAAATVSFELWELAS